MENIERRTQEKSFKKHPLRRIEDKENKIKQDFERIFDDQIEGRKAVIELLESGKDINKI